MPNESNHRSGRDPLPESFATLEEAGDFWDTHSGADYEDEMEDVDLEIDLSSKKVYCAVDRDIVQQLRDQARRQGVSTEELINRWLHEKIAAA